jgi:hypothetical protein
MSNGDTRYKPFDWMMTRFDYTSSTVQYEQYATKEGGFFIVKIDKTNGINTYYRNKDVSDFSTDWANRLSLTYKEAFEEF